MYQDLEQTKRLVEYMREHSVFDTEEGRQHRLLILGKLSELMKKWLFQVGIEKVRYELTKPPKQTYYVHTTKTERGGGGGGEKDFS